MHGNIHKALRTRALECMAHPTTHRRQRDIEVSSDFRDRQINPTSGRNHITFELHRELLRRMATSFRPGHTGHKECQPRPRQAP